MAWYIAFPDLETKELAESFVADIEAVAELQGGRSPRIEVARSRDGVGWNVWIWSSTPHGMICRLA